MTDEIGQVQFVSINGTEVPVVGEFAENVCKAPKFIAWAKQIEPEFVVKQVTVKSTVILPNGMLLFAFLDVDATFNGKKVPGIVFLRGDAVAILPVIKSSGKEYTVLTVQPRLAVGKSAFVEIPAGMLDLATDNFVGAAAKELKEETGITITKADLIWLGEYKPSPGGCDEGITLFAVELEMAPEVLAELQGKLTGVLEENETITLKVIELRDLMANAHADSKSIIAYSAYMLSGMRTAMNSWFTR